MWQQNTTFFKKLDLSQGFGSVVKKEALLCVRFALHFYTIKI